MSQLDTTVDPQAQQELIDWIRQYYADAQGGDLVGFFARCYLGHPYIDHRVTLTGEIAEHFTAEDPVPPDFNACRALVRSPAYIFIEVYSDGHVVPIRTDGTPAI